ncbi:MAG TPA: helix-turn-helix domain-containing protein [Planctomycetaceae bacterium]
MPAAASLLDAERFTLTEAARRLNVHVNTLHRWRQGLNGRRLRCLKIGGRVYVTREELERFVASLSDPPSPQERAENLADRADAAGRHLDRLGL